MPANLEFRPLSLIVPRTVSFFWPQHFPLGKLAMLDGDPGLGKSLFALDLCARLTTGRPFPDGAPGAGPCNVIVLNAEDAAADSMVPRLQSLAADLQRVFAFHSHDDADAPLLRLPSHMDAIANILTQTAAKLLVIDPLVAFLDPGIQLASDLSVRLALLPLAKLAQDHQCAIILIRHINKSGLGRALYRGGGSIGFQGTCRSAWLIAADPALPQRRVLAQVKNNYGPLLPSLAFDIAVRPDLCLDLIWQPGSHPLTADQLLQAVNAAPPALTVLEHACDFLSCFLEDGPKTSRDIAHAATDSHFSQRTLLRAKQKLEISTVRVWDHGNRLSYWLLPGQQMPDSVPADSICPDLEPWLAPLRQQFPPSTPLDDL